MSQFHVNQIETKVRELYQSEYWKNQLPDVHNLSRLLGLYALSLELGVPIEDSQDQFEITDGADDRGLDAVGIDRSANVVVLVQSKWKQDGSGSLDLAGVLKFVDGVRSLIGMKASTLPHASEEMRVAVMDLLRTPGARIRLVTVSTGSAPLPANVLEPITEILAQLNDVDVPEPLASHVHVDQAALFSGLTVTHRPSIELELQIREWGKASHPLNLYYGHVNASEVPQWFITHGANLFARNVRLVLPRSDINQGILTTIEEDPEHFGYFNNGITLLAERVELSPSGVVNRDTAFFRLHGASVVNGAQTVSSLAKVMGTLYEDNLKRAFVMIRVVEIPRSEEDIGRRITRFTNTQNQIAFQDFAFLDEEQHRLARELRVLGYEYLLRTGELRPPDPALAFDAREAAVALACCQNELNYAVTAKSKVSSLFTSSAYQALFNPSTDALVLLRSVLLSRVVDGSLKTIESSTSGIQSGVAAHAGPVITHVIIQEIGLDFIRDPASDFDQTLRDVPARTTQIMALIVKEFPANSYPGNVFKNLARCEEVLTKAGLSTC